jgi:uncharacterized protein (DUF2249 family)
MKDIQFAKTIHAPDLEPKTRHPQIMRFFDELKSGEFMQLTNDHDPKPLKYQFMIEREGEFSWEYMEDGPTLWKVAIGKR